jgi:2-dehydropantoate 2-reductase
MHETASVARACGVAMTDADVASSLAVLESLPAGCTPSMMRDLTTGRPSELEDQAGAVVRIGAAHGVALPVLGSLHALLRPQERSARGELTLPAMVEDTSAAEPREWFIEYHI